MAFDFAMVKASLFHMIQKDVLQKLVKAFQTSNRVSLNSANRLNLHSESISISANGKSQ